VGRLIFPWRSCSFILGALLRGWEVLSLVGVDFFSEDELQCVGHYNHRVRPISSCCWVSFYDG
jgi:hypothetical protein